MRAYHTVTEWRRRNPGVRALLLINPYGHKFLLRSEDPTIIGRFSLIGVIE